MNDNEKYFFDVNGYLSIANALSPEQLLQLNEQVDRHIAQHASPEDRQFSFAPALDWQGPMLDLIDNPLIVPYLDSLFGPPPYAGTERGPFYRLDHTYVTVLRRNAPDAGTFVLHGGGAPFDPGQFYQVSEGAIYNGLVVVAYNLTDVNDGDGGFGCVPGSHKANFRLPNHWNDLRKANPIARAVTGPAGSAVLFTEALTHGTLPWHGVHERRTVFFKFASYCTAHSSSYLDEQVSEWSDLTRRQRAILEAPNARGMGRKPRLAIARR